MSAYVAPELEDRRRALRMSVQALSVRSGVPIATLRRLLRGKRYRSSFEDVLAAAFALGLELRLDGGDAEAYRQARALECAREAATQPPAVEAIRRHLLAGSGRALWSTKLPRPPRSATVSKARDNSRSQRKRAASRA